jgi:DNA-binding MarR family transcriptional regulator
MFHDRDHKAQCEPRTVKLTARDVREAKRLLSVLAGEQRSTVDLSDPNAPAAQEIVDRETLIQRAKQIYLARRRRHRIFGKSMFGEPAWDVLLILYIAEQSGPRYTIGRLTQLAGLATTTALRWLDYLEGQRLIARESHPTDRRAVWVEITDKGLKEMDSYLSETLTTEA